MKRTLLTSVIYLIALGDVDAKTYYVSTTGNNSNSGLTELAAWKTVSYAAGNSSPLVPGDIVYVKAGNYNENVVFSKSGSAGSPITFEGYKNTPGDASEPVFDKTMPYSPFISSNMPTFDGGNRASGTAFNCENQKYLVIKNFQIQNYAIGVVLGSKSQSDIGNISLSNINMSSLGDITASYSGRGILLGSMGTKFSNNNIITNCTVINSAAEGIGINGNNNIITGCSVYCNDNTSNAPTDYYIIVCGSYNSVISSLVQRAEGLSHNGHGIGAKSNAEDVIDNGEALPAITPQYNKFRFNTAINMGESFYVRHRTTQYNVFYHCKAIGTHTGAKGSSGGEGNCIITRDGASNNTFDGCIAENCNSGFVFLDTVEDGDTGANPPGHPGNKNKYTNCLINNCYIGVKFDSYSIPSDAGDNTIAYCTFYKTRYLHYVARHCANMKYIGNIYYGCLPNATGGEFSGGTYASDITPNGANTYFKNCDFINIQGGLPANFLANSVGSIAQDPLFVNPGAQNFRLKSSSPCINIGTITTTVSSGSGSSSSINITSTTFTNIDYDSVPRPQGPGYEIGAYEFQIATAVSDPLIAPDNQVNQKKMKVYPNPATREIPINLKIAGFSNDNLLVVVYDILGRELYSKVFIYEQNGILLSHDNENRIPPGVYVIVATADDQVYKQKLVVQ